MKEKLRILFLIPDFSKGGAERFLVDLGNELHKRDDVEFIIGVLHDGNKYTDLTKDFNIVNLNYQNFSLKSKNECPVYEKLLKDFRPNVVHTHLFLAEFLSSYYVDTNIVYVCHGHDNMHQFLPFRTTELLIKKRILDFLEIRYVKKQKYNKVKTHFIANSNHTFEYYQKVLPKSQRRNVKLIQYGFNYAKFYTPLLTKNLKEKETIKILNVGSFQNKKNQAFIVEIAEQLKISNYKFEFTLIGDGEEFKNVKKLIQEKNLGESFVLKGVLDNVEDYYKTSDIYLHTATYEPFGLIFLEAMASGLPIISLDGKGNVDLFESETGILIKEQNANIFADKILELVENDTLRYRLIENAQELAKSFDISAKTDELLEFYRGHIL